jgi:hypothetical protein
MHECLVELQGLIIVTCTIVGGITSSLMSVFVGRPSQCPSSGCAMVIIRLLLTIIVLFL